MHTVVCIVHCLLYSALYCTGEQELTWDPVTGHLGGEGEEPAHEGQLGRVGGGHVPQPARQVLVVALNPIAPGV